jgi:CheY-like chemotaxis protein
VAVKILVVDDSATMRKILEMTFAGENAEVVTIENGDAAIQRAAELQPQVVFADASMQGTDGYAVARAVKSNPALAETAVIVLASQHTAFDENRARAAGVDDHVLKPFDSQALIDKVQDVLGRPRVRLAPGAAASAPAVAAPVAAPPAAASPAAPQRMAPPLPSASAPRAPTPGSMPRPSAGPAPGSLGHGRKNTVAFGSPPMPQPPAPSAIPQPPAGRPSRPVLELAEDAVVEPARRAEPVRPATPARPAEHARPAEPSRPAEPVRPSAPQMAAAPRASVASPAATMPQPRTVTQPPAAARPGPQAAAPTAAAAAAVSSANGQMTKRLTDLGLTKAQVEGVLALSKEVIEQVVWEVVPEIAEALIKEEIKRLTAE